jgi:ribosomal protein L37AE/L43A
MLRLIKRLFVIENIPYQGEEVCCDRCKRMTLHSVVGGRYKCQKCGTEVEISKAITREETAW